MRCNHMHMHARILTFFAVPIPDEHWAQEINPYIQRHTYT
jgi:hypothetical protein